MYILTLSCNDTTGIVAAVSGFLADNGGFIVESTQFGDPSTLNFFMRTVFTCDKGVEEVSNKFQLVASKFNMKWDIYDTSRKQRLLILVSKQGHCLNDLLHRYASGQLDVEIAGIVSNHHDFAKMAGWYEIPFHHLPVSTESRHQQEEQILKLIDDLKVDLTVLARYMQVLTPFLVGNIYGKAINIHHSFLPGFKGAKPYHQAYDRGVKIIGATAHYVSNDLDEGPIIEQEVTRVTHAHSPEQLLALGRDTECLALARAVKYHVEKRVMLNGNKTIVFN